METSIEVRLEHVFDIRVDFGPDRSVFGPLPGGAKQGYTPAIGGVIEGPRLSGRVVPMSGADYATVRADEIIELNAHYLLEAEDGTLIYINNRGYIVPATPAKSARKKTGKVPQPLYFRCAPVFRCPEGEHDWLSRTVFVGSGERRANPDHSIFRYYAVL